MISKNNKTHVGWDIMVYNTTLYIPGIYRRIFSTLKHNKRISLIYSNDIYSNSIILNIILTGPYIYKKVYSRSINRYIIKPAYK